jgi:hypothetical protein
VTLIAMLNAPQAFGQIAVVRALRFTKDVAVQIVI